MHCLEFCEALIMKYPAGFSLDYARSLQRKNLWERECYNNLTPLSYCNGLNQSRHAIFAFVILVKYEKYEIQTFETESWKNCFL